MSDSLIKEVDEGKDCNDVEGYDNIEDLKLSYEDEGILEIIDIVFFTLFIVEEEEFLVDEISEVII